MPLTTPSAYFDQYNGDVDHFHHVLKYLFKPAIEAAGLTPIPPLSKGSEVIHGDIIRNLETADLVLCDMSVLNPNVFFELGIRTALNKSVALIRDNITERVPFDTNIINYHKYDCGLEPWALEQEVANLTAHLKQCMKSRDGNSLWGYFSMTTRADASSEDRSADGQFLTATGNFTAEQNKKYWVPAGTTITLPDNPIGNKSVWLHPSGNMINLPCTINGNGKNIIGEASISWNINTAIKLTFNAAMDEWRV